MRGSNPVSALFVTGQVYHHSAKIEKNFATGADNFSPQTMRCQKVWQAAAELIS